MEKVKVKEKWDAMNSNQRLVEMLDRATHAHTENIAKGYDIEGFCWFTFYTDKKGENHLETARWGVNHIVPMIARLTKGD